MSSSLHILDFWFFGQFGQSQRSFLFIFKKQQQSHPAWSLLKECGKMHIFMKVKKDADYDQIDGKPKDQSWA